MTKRRTFLLSLSACLVSSCGASKSSGTDGIESGDACGDQIAAEGELCDGKDLNGNACETLKQGFTGGTLLCNETCDGFETRECTSDMLVRIANPCGPVPDGYCGAVGDGVCRYVDPVNGDDDNPGTFERPWRSLTNANTSIYHQYRPDGWKGVSPGDVVYLMEGTYDQVYHPGDDNGPGGGEAAIIYLRGVEGTSKAPITVRNYPGQLAVIDPGRASRGIFVLYSSDIVIEGLEIQNAFDRGIRLEGVRSLVLSRLSIHDTDGLVEANVAGIEVAYSNDVRVDRCILYDNYDRHAAGTGSQTENSCNMVLFDNGGTIRVEDSIFFQSHEGDGQYSGCGLKYKHASSDPGSTFEVSGCYFENHKFYELANATAHARIHHNLFVGGKGANYAYASLDLGGPVHQLDQVVEYNTVYGIGAFYVFPNDSYRSDEWDVPKDIVFRNNIMYDKNTVLHKESRPVQLSAYMTDELYRESRNAFAFDSNCYYNPNVKVTFGIAEEGDNYGALGGAYTLSEWQSTYGWDKNSLEIDPAFADVDGDDFTPLTEACADRGAWSDNVPVVAEKVYSVMCE